MDAILPYGVEVRFTPLYECLNSLHAYICRPSYKKLDMDPAWVKQVEDRIPETLRERLGQMSIDTEWRLVVLLICCCPADTPQGFVRWLEDMTVQQLEQLLVEQGQQPPASVARLRSRLLIVFDQWSTFYFDTLDPRILQRLDDEALQRRQQLQQHGATASFVDQTTAGIVLEPQQELKQLVLVPHYHFQPLNVLYAYRDFTICHYASRVHFGDEGDLPPYEYRMLRSLSEQSRLKILRYLHKGPRSFIEIVRHLGLSKGITHDHVTKLRSAGLLHAHIKGETLVSYSLRQQALDELRAGLLQFIEH